VSNEVVIDPASYRTEEVLRDGGSIHIRAVRPDDPERLLQHFKSLSEQSIYYRFFGIKRTLDDAELARFTQLDFANHVGLVATLREDGIERFIGVARYVRLTEPTRAEVAFAVLDNHQGRGIGTVLLEHLRRVAHQSGIKEFEADVLGMGLEVIPTPVRRPKANSLCERLIGTLRRECLDWIIPLTEQHLRKTLWSWLPHYNRGRPHSSLGPAFPIHPLISPRSSNASGIVSTDRAELWRTP
jgi:GNAT superfamily N-acetyltransferase